LSYGYDRAATEITINLFSSSVWGSDLALIESAKILNSAIRKKNELFFHRWRPANWTYLLGFRKQEQGQNAVEIPKFDPLIAEWEARIAKLRDLKHQDLATVKEVSELTTFNVQRSTFNVQRSPVSPQPIPTFEIAD